MVLEYVHVYGHTHVRTNGTLMLHHNYHGTSVLVPWYRGTCVHCTIWYTCTYHGTIWYHGTNFGTIGTYHPGIDTYQNGTYSTSVRTRVPWYHGTVYHGTSTTGTTPMVWYGPYQVYVRTYVRTIPLFGNVYVHTKTWSQKRVHVYATRVPLAL